MSALAEVTKPAAQITDDLDLVAAVRAGDDRAFELLFERYQGRIAVYVRGMVRDHGRAEDITQEVFISALRRMRETDREITFKPWIYEIAKNACIDAFRRSRNTSEVSLDAEDALGASDHGRLAAPGGGPDAAIDTKLSIDNLCGAFGGLSQQHHDILVMREFEGLSYREIGERLGMSRAGVESTLFRARRRLSAEYEEIVSGERCLRVRAIADVDGGRRAGLRDKRRLARHISHCQPCRRYALSAGVDIAAVRAPASVASKLAALLPMPGFLRRRIDADHVLGAHSPALNAIATVDPTVASGWSKAVATAATVAVAGLGAGAAVKHEAVEDFIRKAPSMVGLGPDRPASSEKTLRLRSASPTAQRARTARPAAATEKHAVQPGSSRSDAAPGAPAATGQAPERDSAQTPPGSGSTGAGPENGAAGGSTGSTGSSGSSGSGAPGGSSSSGGSSGSTSGVPNVDPSTAAIPDLNVTVPAVVGDDPGALVGEAPVLPAEPPLDSPAGLDPLTSGVGAVETNVGTDPELLRSVIDVLPGMGLSEADVAAVLDADARAAGGAASTHGARGGAVDVGPKLPRSESENTDKGGGADRPKDAGSSADGTAGDQPGHAAPDAASADAVAALRGRAIAAAAAAQAAATVRPVSERVREAITAMLVVEILRRASAGRT